MDRKHVYLYTYAYGVACVSYSLFAAPWLVMSLTMSLGIVVVGCAVAAYRQ